MKRSRLDGFDAVEVTVQQSPVAPLRGARRRPTVTEQSEWLQGANDREAAIWQQMDALLDELEGRYLLHVGRCRRDIKWLRKEAFLRGLDWGKK